MADRGVFITLVLDCCHSGWTFQGSGSGTGWFPEIRNCVLLAACTAQQKAIEYHFEREASSGVLTHFLLNALAESGTAMTYETLYYRLRARLQSEFPRQMPMIVGESKRPVLGTGGGFGRDV